MAVTNDQPISTFNLKAVVTAMDEIWGGSPRFQGSFA